MMIKYIFQLTPARWLVLTTCSKRLTTRCTLSFGKRLTGDCTTTVQKLWSKKSQIYNRIKTQAAAGVRTKIKTRYGNTV